MTYTAEYASTDFVTMVFDLMGNIVAVIIDNVAVIVTLVIAGIAIFYLKDILRGLWGLIKGVGGR